MNYSCTLLPCLQATDKQRKQMVAAQSETFWCYCKTCMTQTFPLLLFFFLFQCSHQKQHGTEVLSPQRAVIVWQHHGHQSVLWRRYHCRKHHRSLLNVPAGTTEQHTVLRVLTLTQYAKILSWWSQNRHRLDLVQIPQLLDILFFFVSVGALAEWLAAWLAQASSATLDLVSIWMGDRQELAVWFTPAHKFIRGQGCKMVVLSAESD